MPLTKDEKKAILEGLIEDLKAAKAVVFANFQGMSVSDMQEMRKQMRENGVKYQVAKKTLIKLAAKEAGFPEIPDESMEGPVGVAFSMEDEVMAAQLVHKMGKKNENLKLLGGIFEGNILSKEKAKELALIPGKDQLMAKLVYVLNSPIQGFHGVLNNTVAGFVRVLNAIKEKQEQA